MASWKALTERTNTKGKSERENCGEPSNSKELNPHLLTWEKWGKGDQIL